MGTIQTVPVVIDTNVVVSVLLFGGTPGKLIDLWKSRKINPFVSKEIIDEYLRVFAYPRFRLSENEIEYLMYQEILPYFEVVSPKEGLPIVIKDPSDDKFIRCAEICGSKVIISGDRHLLQLKRYQDIEVVPPAQFLKRFNQ
jgi:putative PIN family toxin of toxin-antitoxin system